MKVQTSAGTYFIDWNHTSLTGYDFLFNYATHCYIKQEDKLIKTGIAHCSIKDNFCREKGRKVSLSRAVKVFDKPVRKEIWEAYLNRKNKKLVKVVLKNRLSLIDSDELQKGDIIHTEEGNFRKVKLGEWEEVKDGSNN